MNQCLPTHSMICSPPLGSLLQLCILPVLGAPSLNAVLQVSVFAFQLEIGEEFHSFSVINSLLFQYQCSICTVLLVEFL